ncbi:hypothetical protein Tco_0162962 [Tanacetum coccineum]
MLPMHPVDPYVEAALQAPEQAPPSPDYVSGPEHLPSLDYVLGPGEPKQAPLSSYYLPEPEYPEYLVPSDAEAPMKDQPLPGDSSPTDLSPSYVAYFDLEEDLEEGLEEDPTDYHADGGDDDDDESSDHDDESSDDDDDDDDVEEDEEEEENKEDEEHLASVDSSVVPIVDPVPSAEDTEAFETDESTPTPVPSPRRRMARMSVQPQIPMSDTAEALIAEYASAPTPPSPPPSLLSPLSSPLPQIPSPPLPLPSPPTTSPTYVEAPLGYIAAKIRLRAASPSTLHPSEIPSPPLLLPSTTHKYDLPEADMPLWKRACFTAPTGRFEIGESSSAAAARQVRHTLAYTVDYGFIDTMDASIRATKSRAMTAVGWSMTELQILLLLRGDTFARWLLLTSVRLLFPDRHGLTLRAGSSPWRPRLELYREMLITATTTTTTTPMTDAQLKALIAQGVTDALAENEANRTSINGDDSHDFGTGSRRTERAARE